MPVDPFIRDQLKNLPKTPGVYLFRDAQGTVIYIGKAINLRNRVRSYFNPRAVAADNRLKIRALIQWIRRIETLPAKTEAEALILESRLLKEYKPKYNTDFVDDKRFLLIRVDGGGMQQALSPSKGALGAIPRAAEHLPKFTLIRNRVDTTSLYYGPFVHGAAVKTLYYELRRRYGVLLNDGTPKKLPDGRWQLYDDARGEIFEHGNIVSTQEYRERVNKACAFLDGQTRVWREEVFEKMKAASASQRFEEAGRWRDLLSALRKARNPERKFLRDPFMKAGSNSPAVEALREALQMKEDPKAIECFDISHISGSYVVASLVRFDDGKPNKDRYRHFKIRGEHGSGQNDDFAAMREVVGRHYKRLVNEGRPLPELIVIDGGAGQLKSALAAFLEEGITPPMMIGLAKREETFVFSDGRPPLTLPRDNAALQLLQRVRDEAHRVANGFNADWRSRALKRSVIDEIPGIGPVRRQKLFAKFKTLQALRRASVEKIAKVIGPKHAQVVVEYLRGALE